MGWDRGWESGLIDNREVVAYGWTIVPVCLSLRHVDIFFDFGPRFCDERRFSNCVRLFWVWLPLQRLPLRRLTICLCVSSVVLYFSGTCPSLYHTSPYIWCTLSSYNLCNFAFARDGAGCCGRPWVYLLSDIHMLPSLQHLYRHADLDPALQGLGRVGPGEQGRELHAQAAGQLGALVYLSMLAKGLVRLHGVAMARVRINVGEFAAGVRGGGCQLQRWAARGATLTTHRTVRHET